jgi:BirA family biotin operon repressor/biotin-[acetyl-CoA-carboxylase] ligase
VRTLPEEFAVPLEALRQRRPGLELTFEWHDEVTSTMDLASAAMLGDGPHGLVILANHQTAGRGRRGREWSSPKGAGLYFSILVRRSTPLVTLAAGVAIRGGILAATGLSVDLKWPNDLMAKGRKLAGILAEANDFGPLSTAVVVGVGINVRSAPMPVEVAARATSIEQELGQPVDRGVLLAAVLELLTDRLAAVALGLDGDILRAWRAASPSATGSRVEWDTPAGPRAGITDGIDNDGALRVKTATGIDRIVSAELHWSP